MCNHVCEVQKHTTENKSHTVTQRERENRQRNLHTEVEANSHKKVKSSESG